MFVLLSHNSSGAACYYVDTSDNLADRCESEHVMHMNMNRVTWVYQDGKQTEQIKRYLKRLKYTTIQTLNTFTKARLC